MPTTVFEKRGLSEQHNYFYIHSTNNNLIVAHRILIEQTLRWHHKLDTSQLSMNQTFVYIYTYIFSPTKRLIMKKKCDIFDPCQKSCSYRQMFV